METHVREAKHRPTRVTVKFSVPWKKNLQKQQNHLLRLKCHWANTKYLLCPSPVHINTRTSVKLFHSEIVMMRNSAWLERSHPPLSIRSEIQLIKFLQTSTFPVRSSSWVCAPICFINSCAWSNRKLLNLFFSELTIPFTRIHWDFCITSDPWGPVMNY